MGKEDQHRMCLKLVEQLLTRGDFDDLLRLVRGINYLDERTKYEKLVRAEQSTDFTREEVREFREVFHRFDENQSGGLCLPEFEKMLGCILPLKCAQKRAEIRAVFESLDE